MSKKSFTKEVGYTNITCIGYGSSEEAYLFWTDDSSSYLQKFESGGVIEKSDENHNQFRKYSAVKIEGSLFFDFFYRNKNDLDSEEVRRFQYEPKKGNSKMVSTGFVSIAHSCHRKFHLRVGKSSFKRQFDFFDLKEYDETKVYASNLTKEEVRNLKDHGWELESDTIYENYPKRNLHFDYNQKLKIVEWDAMITKFIQRLELDHPFEEVKMN